ncbi:hypothetical protein GCM10027085_21230 [Spirosoma aerophilum]
MNFYQLETWDDERLTWSPVLDPPRGHKDYTTTDIFTRNPLTQQQAQRRLRSLTKKFPFLTFRINTVQVNKVFNQCTSPNETYQCFS